jgi:hypothetical protein
MESSRTESGESLRVVMMRMSDICSCLNLLMMFFGLVLVVLLNDGGSEYINRELTRWRSERLVYLLWGYQCCHKDRAVLKGSTIVKRTLAKEVDG